MTLRWVTWPETSTLTSRPSVREVTQMRRQHDAYHGKVCTSTDRHSRQVAHDRRPAVAGVGGGVDLAAGRAEVDAAGLERVHGHGVPQHVDVAVRLGKALRERLPLVAARARLR